jgi:plastocyanin domain-containing protein
MTIIVNLLGVALVAFIVWWFWISRGGSVARSEGNMIAITVEGGVYTPSVLHVSAGKPVTLRFLRNDPSPCAEKVIFSGLDISADLTVGQPYDLNITPEKPGEYDFTCQMAMYRGKLIVEGDTKS